MAKKYSSKKESLCAFCRIIYLFLFCLMWALWSIPMYAFAAGLQSKNPAERAMAARQIAETGHYGKGDIDQLIKCLDDHTRLIPSNVIPFGDSAVSFDPRETTPSKEAIKALVRIGQPAVNKLISAVKSDSKPFGIGYKSANCLGQIGDKKALPTLIHLLNEGKIGRRGMFGDEDEIPIAVARIGRKEVYDELLGAYERAKANNRLNTGIIYSMGYSQDERFLPILKEFVAGKDCSIKLDAIHALGYTKNKKAIPILVDRFNDEDGHARWYSCEALAEIGNREAIPYLKKLIEAEKDSFVIKATNEAIKTLEK
jgi:hypothetical protein